MLELGDDGQMRQHGLEGDYRRGLKRAEKERWCSSPAGAMGDAGWRLRRTWIAGVVVAALALTAAACGSGTIGGRPTGTGSSGFATLPADERPVRVGHGRSFRLPAVSAAVARRAPIGGSRCRVVHDPHFGVHVELYARRLVVSVPSGIGIAPPQRRSGVYVHGGACAYAVRTYEPTGVIVVDTGRALALGTLFSIWGQRLSSDTLAGFRGRVVAFVDGHRWRASLRAIPLRRHAEIVLQVAGRVLPHPAYRFAPGL